MLDFGRKKLKIKSFVFITMIIVVVLTCKMNFAEGIAVYTNLAPNGNFGATSVRSIDIAYAPKRTSYRENEYIDMSGLVLRVFYNDNTSDNVVFNSDNVFEFGFEPSLSTPLNTNHAFVTITYKGYSTSIPISVERETMHILPTSEGSSTARVGRVIEKNNQNTFGLSNNDAWNLFILGIYTASMNNNLGAGQALASVLPTQAIIPDAISKYIQNNPTLLYIVNVDGSYSFSDGMVVYPSGMMVDIFGNTYYADGTVLTSNGLTQFVNGSVRDASGVIYNLDGTINLPDNSYIDKNGVTHYSDGSIKLTDGTIYNIDGSIDFPNGTVLTKSGRVIKRTKKAVETEEKEKNKAAWRYDPLSNEWHVELGDSTSTYYK